MTRASFWRPLDTCSHKAPPSLYMPGLVTPWTLMAESLLIVWFISVYPPFGMSPPRFSLLKRPIFLLTSRAWMWVDFSGRHWTLILAFLL